MPKVTKIKPVLGFQKVPDADLLKQLNTIRERMNGNPNYANPPLSMDTFKTALETFSVLVSDAEDGGKKAISAKKKQREVVIKMATQLGHYVEDTSDGDQAKFDTSGFAAVPKIRTAPQPLPPRPSTGLTVVLSPEKSWSRRSPCRKPSATKCVTLPLPMGCPDH